VLECDLSAEREHRKRLESELATEKRKRVAAEAEVPTNAELPS